jgi:hypothetical protein
LNYNCCSQFAYHHVITQITVSHFVAHTGTPPPPPPPPPCKSIPDFWGRVEVRTNWCPKYYHKHVFNMHAPDRVGPKVLEFLWLDSCSTIARHTMKL